MDYWRVMDECRFGRNEVEGEDEKMERTKGG
jgi:hypothetical protein